ncbi:MAG: SRPBCC family protein [Chryseosolibacter sp.]
MIQLNTNVGAAERIFSFFGGALLLLHSISKEKANAVEGTAATYLLLRGVTGFCPVYDAMGKREIGHKPQNVNIKTVLQVNRPRHQVYAAWRKLEELPLFMRHLHKVTQLDDETSAWEANIPGGFGTISWKSHIVKDDPGSTLSWQSMPGSTIENAGKIEFRDAGTAGTELHIVISYHAPLGLVGENAARLFNPMFEKMVREDVSNFKTYMETGEISNMEESRASQIYKNQ